MTILHSIASVGPDRPRLDAEAEAALQNARMAHLANLHKAGYLLAAGPFLGNPNETFRGLTILNVDPERARVKGTESSSPGRAVLFQGITLDGATWSDALFSHPLPSRDR